MTIATDGPVPNNPQIVTWHGACDMARHGSTEGWTVQASTQYSAAVQVRALLRQQGRVMPADLDWSAS